MKMSNAKKGLSIYTWGLIILILIIAAVLIRELWQKGTNPLRGLYPWDTIMEAVFVIVCIVVVYYFHRRTPVHKS
jgi:hypothetical protein